MAREDRFAYTHASSLSPTISDESVDEYGVGKEAAERRAWAAVTRHLAGGHALASSRVGTKDTSAKGAGNAERSRTAKQA